jgi:hypothetical protein
LNLTITPSSTNTTTASTCGSYTWNGTTYTTSGVYTGTTTNCVTESLNLTITPSSTNTTTITACDSYTWNGQTYTATGVYTGTTANCVTESLNLTVNTCGGGSVVNLKLFIQGYYDSGISAMRSVKNNQDLGYPQTASITEVEDLTIELHETTAPYAAIHTTTATLNINGTLSASFGTAPSGSFYVVIKGTNLVQTWSAIAQTVGTTPLSYDFSSSASQALGDNMIEVESGVWAFYSGDLNQDLVVDGSDSDVLLEDIANSNFGPLATDVNGDGSVDGSDSDIFFPNLENSIFANILE